MEGFRNGMEIFSYFEEYFKADYDIRENIKKTVKELEQSLREINTTMDIIHLPRPFNVKELSVTISCLFENVKSHYEKLSSQIPSGEYYRYHENWKSITQQLLSRACLMHYLLFGTLLSTDEAAKLLGIEPMQCAKFHMCLEDYLLGVLIMTSELARLSVNSVTAKNYMRPVQISIFVKELEAGYRLLNLKNDYLRKRYDALKYDVKKIEEVVYDITLRGLQSETTS